MDKPNAVRIDKWLWSARFFKTRSVAADELARGRVQVNRATAKASRDVRAGDTVELRQGQMPRTVVVLGVSTSRGPAPVAQLLYAETTESLELRARLTERHRLAPEPAAGLVDGRPTKRDRRDIDKVRDSSAGGGDWGSRWSAALDD